MASKVQWFGAQAKGFVLGQATRAFLAMGNAWMERAQELCPVRTGQMRATIGFLVAGTVPKLTLYCDHPAAFFQEFGTRFIPAHPFMRPALSSIPRFLRGLTTLQGVNVAPKYHARIEAYAVGRTRGAKIQVGHRKFK